MSSFNFGSLLRIDYEGGWWDFVYDDDGTGGRWTRIEITLHDPRPQVQHYKDRFDVTFRDGLATVLVELSRSQLCFCAIADRDGLVADVGSKNANTRARAKFLKFIEEEVKQ